MLAVDAMTPQLLKLREQIESLQPIVDQLELELVDDPNWNEPSDSSYLTDAERKNPDIAANVQAMSETNKLISWFGKDGEGYVGLWRGPSNRAHAASPVVRLDTEGQYAIVAMTIPDYLAISMPEEDFGTTREALEAAGFEVAFNPDAIWGSIEAVDDPPNDYRNALYAELKRARSGTMPAPDPTMEKGWTEPPAPAPSEEPVTEPTRKTIPEAAPTKKRLAPTAKKPAPKKKAAAKKPAPKKKAAAKKPAPKKKAAKKPPPKKKKAAKKPAPKKKKAKRR
jgi:hypothetical protein